MASIVPDAGFAVGKNIEKEPIEFKSLHSTMIIEQSLNVTGKNQILKVEKDH